MKKLNDGTKVSASSYYYLLDFNDRDGWKTMMHKFNADKLHELNKTQYIELFEIATTKEIQTLKSS